MVRRAYRFPYFTPQSIAIPPATKHLRRSRHAAIACCADPCQLDKRIKHTVRIDAQG